MSKAERIDVIIAAKDTTKGAFKSTDKSMKGLSSSAKKLGITLSGLFAFKKVTDFMRESSRAFQEQERAEMKLEHIMREVNNATDEQINKLKEQAQSLQHSSVVGDEVVMSLQAQLGTFALSSKAVETLTENTLDLVVANKGVNVTQEDMVNYGNLVGKVMTGQAGALTRYGVTLNDAQIEQIKFGDEMEKATVISEVLQGNYGDLAKAMRDSLEGRIKAVTNQFGDLREEIGKRLEPVMSSFFGWLSTRGIPTVSKSMSGLANAWNNDMFFIRSITETTGWAIKTAIKGWVIGIQTAKNELDNLGGLLGGKKISDQWEDLQVGLDWVEGKITGEGTEAVTQYRKNTKRKSGDVSKTLDDIFGIESTGGGKAPEQKINEAFSGSGGGIAPAPAGGGGKAALKEQMTLAEEVGIRVKELSEIRRTHKKAMIEVEEEIDSLNAKYQEQIEKSEEAIAGIKKSLEDLESAYNADISGLSGDRVEQIVKQEEKIQSIKDSIASTADKGGDASALQNQLREEMSALDQYKMFVEENEEAIQEVRDFRAKTAFEQAMLQIDERQILREQEYEREKEMLEKKLSAEKENLESIKMEHQKALDAMEAQRGVDLKNFKSYLSARVAAWKRAQAQMGGGGGGGGQSVPQMSRGGVATRPVIAGEGQHNEAIVPLPDGRSIPVILNGKGGSNQTINVNIGEVNAGDHNQVDTFIDRLKRELQLATAGAY